MQKLLRNLVEIGALLALIFGLAPFWTVLGVGFVAVKGVDVLAGAFNFVRDSRLRAHSNVSDDQIRRNRQRHRQNSRKRFFNTTTNQWDLTQFPLDMYPTLGIHSTTAEFTCAGISNIIHAEAKGRMGAEFSMMLKDEYKAKMIEDHIQKNAIVGTRVERLYDSSSESFKFKVISDNAVDISEIVRQFYPPQKFEVSRRIEVTHQYLVEGCSSYEEAVEKFKENRHRYSDWDALNSVTVIQDTVNGVKAHPEQINDFLNYNMLEAGQWIINETTWDVYSKHVTVNGDIDRTIEDLRSDASESFETSLENLVEDQCSAEPVISNALEGKEITRVAFAPDGHQMQLMYPDSPELNIPGRNMIMRFSSEEDLLRFMENPSLLVGKPVLIDSTGYSPSEGEYILTIPLDSDLFSSLESHVPELRSVCDKYSELGVSAEQLQLSYIFNELERQGYSTAYLNDVPDISLARINGIPYSDYIAWSERRMTMQAFEDLSEDELRHREKQWMKDMSRIISVDMNLDLKTKEMILSFDIQNSDSSITHKVESRKLDDKEILGLVERGKVSNVELKDLVLMAYPTYFNAYSDKGKALYVDPINDFIKNTPLKTTKQFEIEQKERRTAERTERKQSAERKKLASSKMRIS